MSKVCVVTITDDDNEPEIHLFASVDAARKRIAAWIIVDIENNWDIDNASDNLVDSAKIINDMIIAGEYEDAADMWRQVQQDLYFPYKKFWYSCMDMSIVEDHQVNPPTVLPSSHFENRDGCSNPDCDGGEQNAKSIIEIKCTTCNRANDKGVAHCWHCGSNPEA
jgi:hypothetical protein